MKLQFLCSDKQKFKKYRRYDKNNNINFAIFIKLIDLY